MTTIKIALICYDQRGFFFHIFCDLIFIFFKDEREDVQKKTFAKWINSQLQKIKCPPVRDLFQDLRDGTILIKLLEILTGKEIRKEIGKMKVHHMGNVNIVLSTLRENKVHFNK
jgi:hypothetical protein